MEVAAFHFGNTVLDAEENAMKTRSPFEICLPLILFAVAGVVSVVTLILASLWMTIGVCAIGHRSLGDFPVDGIPWRWRRGPRSLVLWFYHLAWWPWYVRDDLNDIATRARKSPGSRKQCGHDGPPSKPGRRSHDKDG